MKFFIDVSFIMNCLSMYAYNVVLSKKHIGKKYNMSNLKKYEFYRQERLGGANSPQTNISYRKKKKAVFQCDSIFPFIGGSEPPPTSQEEFNKLTVCINN